jgi:hypothetical protein
MVFGNNLVNFGAFVASNPQPTVVKPQTIDVAEVKSSNTDIGAVAHHYQGWERDSGVAGSVDFSQPFTIEINDNPDEVEDEDTGVQENPDTTPENGLDNNEEETNTNAQGLGLGLSGMTQADEEQLADKADETHISGGNEPKNQTSESSENQYALIGVLLLGAGYGAYKYESNTSFFSKTWNNLRKSIKR